MRAESKPHNSGLRVWEKARVLSKAEHPGGKETETSGRGGLPRRSWAGRWCVWGDHERTLGCGDSEWLVMKETAWKERVQSTDGGTSNPKDYYLGGKQRRDRVRQEGPRPMWLRKSICVIQAKKQLPSTRLRTKVPCRWQRGLWEPSRLLFQMSHAKSKAIVTTQNASLETANPDNVTTEQFSVLSTQRKLGIWLATSQRLLLARNSIVCDGVRVRQQCWLLWVITTPHWPEEGSWFIPWTHRTQLLLCRCGRAAPAPPPELVLLGHSCV